MIQQNGLIHYLYKKMNIWSNLLLLLLEFVTGVLIDCKHGVWDFKKRKKKVLSNIVPVPLKPWAWSMSKPDPECICVLHSHSAQSKIDNCELKIGVPKVL